ncbi:MAG: TatD family hydrolase [Myxococcaceae bacterium]
MIDTHCHLDAARFDDDRERVLERSWAAGLRGIVVPAVAPDTWEALLTLPRKDPRLQVGLGIHPQLLPELPPEEDNEHLERLDALLARGGAIAVGECGIDAPSLPGAPLERQLHVLKRHFELARKHHLPVLVHCHRLHPVYRDFLEETPAPDAGVLMHSFSGGIDFAKRYAKRGFFFSFAGPVTFLEARKPLDALKAIPIDRLMAETDAPDQAPHPHRGTRSEPSYLPLIIGGMAHALGRTPDEMAQVTADNARRFFAGVFG